MKQYVVFCEMVHDWSHTVPLQHVNHKSEGFLPDKGDIMGMRCLRTVRTKLNTNSAFFFGTKHLEE